ncbi:Uncharacterized protein pbN1_30430 [Aromatoleum bremense]|nr:Uncharacterized protein pbN1_30430 [Aromatoleum bremense]
MIQNRPLYAQEGKQIRPTGRPTSKKANPEGLAFLLESMVLLTGIELVTY